MWDPPFAPRTRWRQIVPKYVMAASQIAMTMRHLGVRTQFTMGRVLARALGVGSGVAVW